MENVSVPTTSPAQNNLFLPASSEIRYGLNKLTNTGIEHSIVNSCPASNGHVILGTLQKSAA